MKTFILLIFFLSTSLVNLANKQYDLVIAQDGSGDFTSIQKAINATKAFPQQRIIIFIKNGTYNEKVIVYAWNTNLTIIGESTDSTIITYNDYFDKINLGRNSTFHTFTMKVEGNNFVMENLSIENTAGDIGQAVALHVDADLCIFRNIRITGHQDVLYTAGINSRQYYTNCYIEGTTDFIFGAATSLFENCTIHSKKNSYITAASTAEGIEFGYVFMNCKLTAMDGVDAVYLGRPWRKFAKTVFIKCKMDNHIHPEGWKEWSNKDEYQSTFYAEYNNYGKGADTSKRIQWSHQLTEKMVKKYTTENIFKSRIFENE